MTRQKDTNPLQSYLPFAKHNKYILTLVVFLVWMTFADKHSFMTQYQLISTCSRSEQKVAEYKESIVQVKADIKDLQQNKEKYAREKYFMKKKDEDVYIFDFK